MKLWSIQCLADWNRLECAGRLRCDGFDSRNYNSSAYSWIRNQLEERVGASPQPGCWPIWAWYQWEGRSRRCPELRARNVGEAAVRIELEIDDSRVLLSDLALWHVALNKGAVLDSDEAIEQLDRNLEAAGFGLRDDTQFAAILDHPEFGPVFKESWRKMFDLNWADKAWTRPLHRKSIQAIFWEIKRADVLSVAHFVGA